MSHSHDGGRSTTTATGAVLALVGAPNAGKSSVFNRLTGLRVRTANYPGVTVTHSTGVVSDSHRSIQLVDLPGTYGLTPVSPDEHVVLDHLEGRLPGTRAPDALLVVVDATTLRRSLSLVAQALATDRPCAVVLTMTDELDVRGGRLDAHSLSQALGIPVYPVVGHRGRGVPALREGLLDWPSWQAPVLLPPADDRAQLDGWILSVLDRVAYRPAGPPTGSRSLDSVLLHPVWGLVTFAVVMAAFFQAIFTLAAPLQGYVESFFGWLGGIAAADIGNPLLADLVSTGLIGGIGGVLVFLPQIILLFTLLSLLEGVGYLARAAVLMDRVMAISGLDGRAFVSMLSSIACAVPGIMSTRTMPSSRDRIATMLAAPLMPCSARLPVYLLLTGMLVPTTARWGPFGMQGLALFALYLAGGISAMIAASVLRATVLRRGGLPFYLELPPFRMPTLRTLAQTVWSPVRMFLRKVGTIILVANLVLWALLTFPSRTAETAQMSPAEASSYTLDHSFAASIGHAVEPVFEPLGFDWRINIGLVSAMAAREVFVSTLGQVAAAQDPENPKDVLRTMTFTDGAHVGERVFTAPTIVALLVYFVFAMQCISTLAVMRRESNSWRWPAFSFVSLTLLAWAAAWVARAVALAVT